MTRSLFFSADEVASVVLSRSAEQRRRHLRSGEILSPLRHGEKMREPSCKPTCTRGNGYVHATDRLGFPKPRRSGLLSFLLSSSQRGQTQTTNEIRNNRFQIAILNFVQLRFSCLSFSSATFFLLFLSHF